MASGASFNPAMLSNIVAVPPKKQTATIRPNNQLVKTPTKVFWPDPYQQLTQGAHVGHVAWDIVAPPGSSVYAPVSGTVVGVRPMDAWGWGNSIEILTPDGFHLYFAHLSGFEVQPGQQVIGGQEIGKSGNTFTPGVGHSTGPHLHFEVRTSTSPLDAIDPKDFFSKENTMTPMPAWDTSVDMTGIEQGMGVGNPLPTQNALPPAGGTGTTGLTSPGVPSTPSVPAGTHTAAKSNSTAGNADRSAPAGTQSQPKKPAKQGSAAVSAPTTSSKETVLASWNLMDSPILGKITLKITPSTIAFAFGILAIVIGLAGEVMQQYKRGFDIQKDVLGAIPKITKAASAV